MGVDSSREPAKRTSEVCGTARRQEEGAGLELFPTAIDSVQFKSNMVSSGPYCCFGSQEAKVNSRKLPDVPLSFP